MKYFHFLMFTCFSFLCFIAPSGHADRIILLQSDERSFMDVEQKYKKETISESLMRIEKQETSESQEGGSDALEVVHAVESCDTYQTKFRDNGLVSAIWTSYSEHIPLELRPDDVFHSVIAILGNYILNNSEKMREKFVSHQGKKELVVGMSAPHFREMTPEKWDVFLSLMSDKIGENIIDQELLTWSIPSFSTTDNTDKTISKILLMGSMQEYFSYKFLLCCGIPKVTLKGELSDWEKLLEKVNYLKKFDDTPIAKWAQLLEFVVRKFVSAYEKDPDNDFWQRAVSSESYGSGGQSGFSGWFTVFAPFDKKGKYMLNSYEDAVSTYVFVSSMYESNDFPSSIIGVPVKVLDHPNHVVSMRVEGGKAYKTKFYAGSNMIHFDKNSNTIKPSKAWGILLLEPPSYEETSDSDRALYEKEWEISKHKLAEGKVPVQ